MIIGIALLMVSLLACAIGWAAEYCIRRDVAKWLRESVDGQEELRTQLKLCREERDAYQLENDDLRAKLNAVLDEAKSDG